jgi:hypothetical protein
LVCTRVAARQCTTCASVSWLALVASAWKSAVSIIASDTTRVRTYIGHWETTLINAAPWYKTVVCV